MSTDHDGYVGGRTVDPVNGITVNPKQYDVNCDEARGKGACDYLLDVEDRKNAPCIFASCGASFLCR